MGILKFNMEPTLLQHFQVQITMKQINSLKPNCVFLYVKLLKLRCYIRKIRKHNLHFFSWQLSFLSKVF
jgi:hypothetical protein